MKIKSTVAALCAAVALLGAGELQAKTVNLSSQVPGNVYGTENWSTSVDQTILDRGGPIGQNYVGTSGAFRLTDGVKDIIAFGMDPYMLVNLTESFTVTENATVLDKIDWLFSFAYAQVTDAVSASAFQVALWEVISETDDNLNVFGGNHFLNIDTDAKIGMRANYYLSRMDTAETGQYRYTTYSNSGQDLISVSPVPLPASALLLIAGMGGLAALRRKQR